MQICVITSVLSKYPGACERGSRNVLVFSSSSKRYRVSPRQATIPCVPGYIGSKSLRNEAAQLELNSDSAQVYEIADRGLGAHGMAGERSVRGRPEKHPERMLDSARSMVLDRERKR